MRPVLRYALVVMLGVSFGQIVAARDLAGVKLKDVIRLSPETDPIRLNGASERKRAAHTLYIGGLYLAEKRHNLDAVLADRGPKRIFILCRTARINPETIIRTFAQGLTINNAPADLAKIKQDIVVFQRVWAENSITYGDEIWIDYIPDEGTRVSINGKVRAMIPGRAFYNAFLRAWLGKYPVSPRIKRAMLGKS